MDAAGRRSLATGPGAMSALARELVAIVRREADADPSAAGAARAELLVDERLGAEIERLQRAVRFPRTETVSPC